MATARRYKPEDIERGLTALAVYGNSVAASEHSEFKDRTLRHWATKHPERLAEIQRTRATLIDQACIEEFRQIVLESTAATREAVQAERQRLAQGQVRDTASSARNLATVAGIATDKMLIVDGRPNSINLNVSGEDVLKQLAHKGYVDTTAEEDDHPQIEAA